MAGNSNLRTVLPSRLPVKLSRIFSDLSTAFSISYMDHAQIIRCAVPCILTAQSFQCSSKWHSYAECAVNCTTVGEEVKWGQHK